MYLSKKAVLEWLDDRRYKSPWIESFRERLESGAFDVQPEPEIQRLRAALEDIRYQVQQSDHPAGLGILATINQALSTTTEPTGAQRVRDKMKSLFEAWDLRGICKDSLEGYEQGVMLELIVLCEEIAGINATEKEDEFE